MKATGIVRRIDDLGRVVIPSVKELFYGKKTQEIQFCMGLESAKERYIGKEIDIFI